MHAERLDWRSLRSGVLHRMGDSQVCLLTWEADAWEASCGGCCVAGQAEHDACVARVFFERADNFQADAFMIESDDFGQFVGWACNAELNGREMGGPGLGHVNGASLSGGLGVGGGDEGADRVGDMLAFFMDDPVSAARDSLDLKVGDYFVEAVEVAG